MSESIVKLEGAMTIAKAEELYGQLEEIFRSANPTKIDASEVSRVDTSILQLLVSFVNSKKSGGVTVEWVGVSDDFLAGAKILGLEEHLDL